VFDIAVLSPGAIDDFRDEKARSPLPAACSSPKSALVSWSERALRARTSARLMRSSGTLLEAKSIAYIDPAAGGSSGIYVQSFSIGSASPIRSSRRPN